MSDSADRVNGKLKDFLLQKKPVLLRRWFDLILETYPPDARRFLESQKNPFANPVGSTIRRGIEGLYEELGGGWDPEKISSLLDPMIRIRAVQDLSPSQAVSFVLDLKQVIRQELEKEIRENQLGEELSELESRIDKLTLLTFDGYMKCREKVFEIKVNELRNRSMLMERVSARQPQPGLKSGRQASIDQPK